MPKYNGHVAVGSSTVKAWFYKEGNNFDVPTVSVELHGNPTIKVAALMQNFDVFQSEHINEFVYRQVTKGTVHFTGEFDSLAQCAEQFVLWSGIEDD